MGHRLLDQRRLALVDDDLRLGLGATLRRQVGALLLALLALVLGLRRGRDLGRAAGANTRHLDAGAVDASDGARLPPRHFAHLDVGDDLTIDAAL